MRREPALMHAAMPAGHNIYNIQTPMEYNFREIEKKWQRRWVDQKTYHVAEDSHKEKFYVLNMFPYPSGAGLHVGHPLGYIASDIYARYKRLRGYNVLNPMGYDAYGLPAEQYAIQTGQHPAVTTEANINHYREQLDKIGFSFDWDREVRTCDPKYYHWTQWAFQRMFESYYDNRQQKAMPIAGLVAAFEQGGTEGIDAACSEDIAFTADDWRAMDERRRQEVLMNYRIAYLGETMVNWCPQLGTVLANDEVVDGVSERGGYPVVQKKMRQWCLRVSAYAQRLLDGLDTIDWTDSLKETQRNWIGRSEGAEITFTVSPHHLPPVGGEPGERLDSDIKERWEQFKTAHPCSYGTLKNNAKANRSNPTEAENALWQALRAKQLGEKFRRQHIICDCIADFVSLKSKLIIEVDGGYHNETEQAEADMLRTQFLNEQGFKVIRFTNDEVLNNIDGVVEKIKQSLASSSVAEANQALSPRGRDGEGLSFTIFTTRADTMFGVTFMVLAPESELVAVLTTPGQKAEVDAYLERTKKRTERERIADRSVSGVFTGSYAVNPLTGEEIPIWVSDYVLAGYGTGAIMAVPAHDSRDYAFAKHFGLEIRPLIEGCDVSEQSFDAKEGIVCNSPRTGCEARGGLVLNGLTVKEAIAKTKAFVEEQGLGRVKVNYRLRDAIFSRQRYWGEPFPVYYKDGMPYMIPEDCLPLELPEVATFLPTETGEPPLGHATRWAWDTEARSVTDNSRIDNKTVFPLELNTMPGFAGSSAYYLRYMDPHNDNALVSAEADSYWREVDLYVGGTEHATGHLIYSRFWNKFLHDIGVSAVEEPFRKLVNQGMIQGRSNFVYRINRKAPSDSPRGGEGRLSDANLSSPTGGVEGAVTALLSPQQGETEGASPVFVSLGLKDRYDTTPLHVDVNIVHGDVLDIDAFRKWRPEYANAEFVLEEGKYVCGWAVEKMSKSMYNVVNPDMIVDKYGADTLRLYEMFLGPVEQSKPWDTNGIDGCHRFLKKFWALFYGREGDLLADDREPSAAELKAVHKLIKKVTQDIEQFSYNTSISAFMICVNELGQLKCHNRSLLADLVVLIAPFAPHIAEELWEALGGRGSVCDACWPQWNEQYLVESTVQLTVSFNGKARFQMDFAADADNATIEQAVLADERSAKYMGGKQVVKVIIVPRKIVNVVVK